MISSTPQPPIPTERLQGWEARLSAVIDEARVTPYQLGSYDCLRLACAAVAALTGVDRWPEFAGTYRCRRSALLAIARRGASFEVFIDMLVDHGRVDAAYARRGDLACVQTEDGDMHLGVVLGAEIALLGEGGLRLEPLHVARCLWRVA